MVDQFNDQFNSEKQARYILDISLQLETPDIEMLFKLTQVIYLFTAQGICFKGSAVPMFLFKIKRD